MRLRVLRGERALAPPVEPLPGPPGPTPPWRRLLRFPELRDVRPALSRNPGLKMVSLLLAFFLWFSINVSERDAEGTLEIPLRVRSLASGLIVTNQPAKPVAVTVRGPRTILDGVDERRTRLSLDLSTATPGEMRIELNADMIRPELPRRLKVVRIEPARVKVRIERLARRRLPVRPELAGMPPLGYTAEASVSPGEVEASGPASKVEDLKEIKTEPVELHTAPDPLQRTVLLSWAGDFVSFAPDHVIVTVRFQPTMMSRRFEHVEVTVRNLRDGARAKLVPPRVDLTVQGPQHLLSSYRIPDGSVYVDAAGLDPGTHRVTPQVELPQALEVSRRDPEVQSLEITPPTPRGAR
ncbi:MAG TPA: CdaR family protein [Candidatus Binatus sp.]|nr:CdaR family protein [Candidatus Binatus sp.]